MDSNWQRRLRHGSLLGVGLAALAWLLHAQEDSLRRASFTSGYVLLAALWFLALYHFRKRLIVLPLGSSTGWLQLHLYVGIGSAIVFWWHVGERIPNGVFESCLAGLFAAVWCSGVLGLYLSRTLPRRLTRLSQQVLLEQTPAFLLSVRQAARQLTTQAVSVTGSTVLADFYTTRLSSFFECQRSWLYQVFPGSGLRRRMLAELDSLQRYCSPLERGLSDQLFQLIRRKDDLDYQWALQRLLRGWLFWHVGLTYGLLLFAVTHAILVHAFHGGLR